MSTIPYTQLIQEYLAAIELELSEGIKLTAQDELSVMHAMLRYHMGWEGEGANNEARGKRIRPLLVLLSCTACSGDWKLALPAASAVELVHNFSLIHDDIEDNSPLRRGRPTLWKLYGIPQAINAGDAMFALAHLEILKLEKVLSPGDTLRAVTLLQQTCLRLTQGQYLDLSYENRSNLNLNDYWSMISGKTAALLATSTHLGALVAGADNERQSHYSEFGRYLGLAFQARDDMLGIWGDAALMGKSSESDLLTGKKTLPVLFGLSKNSTFAKRWSKGSIAPEEVADIAHLLEDEGARSYCEQISSQLTDQAIATLDLAKPIGIAKETLRYLTEMLLSRKI